MLRPVSDSLYNHLLTQFPPGIAYPRVVFEGEPMPPPLAHFLSQTLQYRLDVALDQLRKARSDWFDYNHPHVQKAYTTFVTAINKQGHIPAGAWEKTLSQAVRYVTAYLVRPVSTLVEFVYHDTEEPLDPDVIFRRMSYFGTYSYFREATEAYFDRKQLTALERERYVSLLTRVDQHLTQKYTPEQWMRLLQPLFALVTMVYPAGLPIPLLRMFFAEKGANVVERTLAEEQVKWGVDLLDAAGLRKLLETLARPVPRQAPAPQAEAVPSPMPVQRSQAEQTQAPTPIPTQAPRPQADPSTPQRVTQAPQPPAAPVQASPYQPPQRQPQQPSPRAMPPIATPQASQIAPQQRHTPPPARPQQPPPPPQQRVQAPAEPPSAPTDASTSGVPLWKQFQQRDQPASPPSGPASQQPAPTAPPSATPDGDAVPLWKRFQKNTSPSPSQQASTQQGPTTSKLLQLEQAVLGPQGSQLRDRFVRHLFNGSLQAYAENLEHLNNTDTWAQASQIIARDVFQRFQVNIYDDHAVAFTNMIEARF